MTPAPPSPTPSSPSPPHSSTPPSPSPSPSPSTITFFLSFFATLTFSLSFLHMLSSTVRLFPYPYPPPPPLPLPSPPPPPQGSNQALPKQSSLVLAPLTIPSPSSIETSLNIPPKLQSFVLGGTKRSFHVDAKLFSFSFDGGRCDSYAIHETRRNVKSSIWVGRRGIEWLLTCLEDIRD